MPCPSFFRSSVDRRNSPLPRRLQQAQAQLQQATVDGKNKLQAQTQETEVLKRSLASQQKAVQEYVVSLQEAERARALAEEQVNAVRAKLQEVSASQAPRSSGGA